MFWVVNRWTDCWPECHSVRTERGSYVCRRLTLGCGRNLPRRPHSSAPACCSHTSDIRRCCDRSFPPRWRQCGRYICRACRIGAHRRPLQGLHRNPPDRRHSEDLRTQYDQPITSSLVSVWITRHFTCCHVVWGQTTTGGSNRPRRPASCPAWSQK